MSNAIKNGGPAFPMAKVTVLAEDGTPNEACAVMHDGMTLRDYFAAKALQGLLAQSEGTALLSEHKYGAEYAYAMADAMLAERSKRISQ